MYDIEATLLSSEDVYGGNNGKKKLKILKKIGTKCELTDFSILLEAETVDFSNGKYYGSWNTTSPDGSGDVRSVERNGYNHSYADYRYAGIRPVLNFKNRDEFDNILKRTQTDENGLLVVELGSYPINSVDESLTKILDSYMFNASSNNFKNNVGRITVDSVNPHDRRFSFEPFQYNIVEYKGKRYVNVKSKSDSLLTLILSNGKVSLTNNYYWLEISPVIWYIDKEKQRLISKYLVASGIRFCDRGEYTGDFKTTEMYEWLNKYFIQELFQGKDLTEEQKQESTKNMNEKSEKINLIVKEIRELLPTYFDSDDIMIKINNLVTKYNSDIKSIYNSNGLTTKIMDKDYLYNKLVNDLEEILSSLKQSSLKYKNYVDILNYIKECLIIINSEDEIKEINDELQKDIVAIKSVIIPFLENNNWLLKLKEIFEIEEKSIRNYLKDNGEIPSYKTKEEFIIHIRDKLQEYLFNISEAVRNKNIVQELQEGYLKIMTGIFTKVKDDYINNYLNELNKIVILINKKGTQTEKDKLDILLSENSTLDIDTMQALEKLSEVYKKVYSIYLDIIDRENKLEEIDNYTIKI